jgi:deazaflavin-dependent oxidoreductase (nitroreductase family)
MPAVTRNRAIELFWRIHPAIYRFTGGRLLGRIGGVPVLLLTTRGRKSGAPRKKPLLYLAHGDAFVVAASFAGEPRHPAWWLNLLADPRAEVQVGSRVIAVRAREAEGDERTRLWRAIVAQDASFAEYERRTTRRIPVVVLEPAGGA